MNKKIKTMLAFLMVATLSLSLFSACESKPQTQQPTTETVTFIDSVGREVVIPKEIKKVAVTGVLAQMMVFAIAPDQMVALADDFDNSEANYIAEKYTSLPILGNLYGTKGDVNFEELLSLAPDVVIDMGEPSKTVAEDMDKLQATLGIPFVHISTYLENTDKAFEMLGELLSKEQQAKTLASYTNTAYEEATKVMQEVGGNRKNIVYCLGGNGTNVIASQSYQSELINFVANNVAVVESPTSKGTGNEVDMEQLYIWNPEVLIFNSFSVYDEVAKNPVWQNLDAVKNGNYFETPYGPYDWVGNPPSVQRYLGLMWYQTLLYPEYVTYDLEEKVKEYYKIFYHCDLSNEQYQALVQNSIAK